MSTPTSDRLAYRVNEAAAALGFSRSQIYALMDEGVLRYTRVGASRIIPASELERLLAIVDDAPAAS